MINHIIAEVVESDRNIYITIEDGALISVNYSQGAGELDFHFLTTHNQGLTDYVIKELIRLGDELYSPDLFFPSPYWDQQVKAIDNAIWKLLEEENKRADLIKQIEKLEKQLSELKSRL